MCEHPVSCHFEPVSRSVSFSTRSTGVPFACPGSAHSMCAGCDKVTSVCLVNVRARSRLWLLIFIARTRFHLKRFTNLTLIDFIGDGRDRHRGNKQKPIYFSINLIVIWHIGTSLDFYRYFSVLSVVCSVLVDALRFGFIFGFFGAVDQLCVNGIQNVREMSTTGVRRPIYTKLSSIVTNDITDEFAIVNANFSSRNLSRGY